MPMRRLLPLMLLLLNIDCGLVRLCRLVTVSRPGFFNVLAFVLCRGLRLKARCPKETRAACHRVDDTRSEGSVLDYYGTIKIWWLEIYVNWGTNVLEMDLHLTDVEPVFYRPYCMSFGECGEIERIVQELKEADIIEETDSPLASPVLLVRKKSGEFWMCVDYRKLNNETVELHYPLPHIDDQLDRLRGSVINEPSTSRGPSGLNILPNDIHPLPKMGQEQRSSKSRKSGSI
ncbi:hypothetical protein GEV33_006667 [Tenebrio molitor]|uniref:Uncharacterized protein n=1 Tax=Tenebrio molitor TaxID=7067 RepID=A0A8J6HK54_TENMO|nr:hypothetical protein GEV33_006667 [Tenebrio molitor]